MYRSGWRKKSGEGGTPDMFAVLCVSAGGLKRSSDARTYQLYYRGARKYRGAIHKGAQCLGLASQLQVDYVVRLAAG